MEEPQKEDDATVDHLRHGESAATADQMQLLWAQDVHHPKAAGSRGEEEDSPGDGNEVGIAGSADDLPRSAEDCEDVRVDIGSDDYMEKCAAGSKRDPL